MYRHLPIDLLVWDTVIEIDEIRTDELLPMENP